MRSAQDLRSTLQRIDGRGYKAYKDIQGQYQFDRFELIIDHVQGDPFAAPSRLRVRVPQRLAAFPPDSFANRSREIALRDFLARAFHRAAYRLSRPDKGSGKGGLIAIDRPGQQILERTAALVDARNVEARFVAGLPAFGRRVAGRLAQQMLFDELPRIVEAALFFEALDRSALYTHIRTAEDADALRDQLADRNLVAFIADGSILPRASGIDPRPLPADQAVPFLAPDELRAEFQLPNRPGVTGMGIPRGITLIVGGGYHGKSTLLNALELGVYNHIPGDGRELVVTDPNAVKIRAEDGRRVEKVDLSPFITNLPRGQRTDDFSTENASGSTSQAANILEALEAGASTLLIDEDTSATNFMIRDHRMQELIAKDHEPITPFIDKARQLYSDLGVSTVLVIGGSGDYFDVADSVVAMMDYRPLDVTARAREIAQRYRAERRPEGGESFGQVRQRICLPESFDASRGRKAVAIKTHRTESVQFGETTLDLAGLEQLVDISQTRAIADAIHYAQRYFDGRRTLAQVLDALLAELERSGMDGLTSTPAGCHARFRRLELAGAINRLRTLRCRQI